MHDDPDGAAILRHRNFPLGRTERSSERGKSIGSFFDAIGKSLCTLTHDRLLFRTATNGPAQAGHYGQRIGGRHDTADETDIYWPGAAPLRLYTTNSKRGWSSRFSTTHSFSLNSGKYASPVYWPLMYERYIVSASGMV